MYICICMSLSLSIYIYVYVYRNVYINRLIHTYIYIYIYIYILERDIFKTLYHVYSITNTVSIDLGQYKSSFNVCEF